MEESGSFYPKDWTHGSQRSVIADRQRRDYGAKVERSLSEVGFLAARCQLRYAQEALLTGDTGKALHHTMTALALRSTARAMRTPVSGKGRVGHS